VKTPSGSIIHILTHNPLSQFIDNELSKSFSSNEVNSVKFEEYIYSHKDFVIGCICNPYLYAVGSFLSVNNLYLNNVNKSKLQFLSFLEKSGPYAKLLDSNQNNPLIKSFFLPQSSFFINNNKSFLNFTIKYERLNKSVSFLNKLFDIKITNFNNDMDNFTDFYLTNKHWDLAKIIYQEDFYYFDYSM